MVSFAKNRAGICQPCWFLMSCGAVAFFMGVLILSLPFPFSLHDALPISQKSFIIKHLVEEKKVKIAAGVYNMVTGKVELVEVPASEKAKGDSAGEHQHVHTESHSPAGH